MTDRPSDRGIAQAVLALAECGDPDTQNIAKFILSEARDYDAIDAHYAAAPEGAQPVVSRGVEATGVVSSEQAIREKRGPEGAQPVAWRQLLSLGGGNFLWTRWLDCDQPIPLGAHKVEYAYTTPPQPQDAARDREDAERYRWLRSPDRTPGPSDLWVAMGSFGTGIGQWAGGLLDDLIDAARGAAKGPS